MLRTLEREQADAVENAEITPRGRSVSSTNSDLATRATRRFGRQWQRFIDTLHEWWTDPDIFDDECYDPPLQSVVAKAIAYAERFRDMDLSPPSRVVTDAGRGIIFERRSGSSSEKVHFWDDGKVELIQMCGHKVTDRRCL